MATTPLRLLATVTLTFGLPGAVAAKIVPIFAQECPCYWRTDGLEWSNHRQYMRCAMTVLRGALEAGTLSAEDGARQLRYVKQTPCGRRSFTRRYTCGGVTRRRCRRRDEWCAIDDPACTGTQLGYCLSRGPCVGGTPVCGCDGVTYESWCRLPDAGVAWAHDGPCAGGSRAP